MFNETMHKNCWEQKSLSQREKLRSFEIRGSTETDTLWKRGKMFRSNSCTFCSNCIKSTTYAWCELDSTLANKKFAYVKTWTTPVGQHIRWHFDRCVAGAVNSSQTFVKVIAKLNHFDFVSSKAFLKAICSAVLPVHWSLEELQLRNIWTSGWKF